jgi:hypothetical protein
VGDVGTGAGEALAAPAALGLIALIFPGKPATALPGTPRPAARRYPL